MSTPTDPNGPITISEDLAQWLADRPGTRSVGRPMDDARFPTYVEPVPTDPGPIGAGDGEP